MIEDMTRPSRSLATARVAGCVVFALVTGWLALAPPIVGAERKKVELGYNWEWEARPGITSAMLAPARWSLVSSTGHSWPDGRQTVVTFWRSPTKGVISRCIDHFNKDMTQTGGLCYRPKLPKGTTILVPEE